MTITLDRVQKQQLANKKAEGKEKPYTACKECLFILDNCILCEKADMFTDRMIIYPDVISETVIDRNRSLIKVAQQTLSNRVTTQRRDGCNF